MMPYGAPSHIMCLRIRDGQVRCQRRLGFTPAEVACLLNQICLMSWDM